MKVFGFGHSKVRGKNARQVMSALEGLVGRALTLEPADYLEGSAEQQEAITSQFDGLGYAFHDFNIEQSARSRGATVWAALSEIGAEGMRNRVVRHNSYARRLAEIVQSSPTLELLAPVTLSICCFRYVPADLRDHTADSKALNDLNRGIVRSLHREGRHVPSSTDIGGQFAIRPCFINPRTSWEDVANLVGAVERIGAQVWASMMPHD